MDTILNIILWILKPEHLFKLIKGFVRKNINYQGLEHIEDIGLILNENDVICDKRYIGKNRYVYFPVVPTSTPNLIHAVLMHYVKILSSFGLKIVVFVFDDYYKELKRLDQKIANSDVTHFIKSLKEMGLRRCNYKIILESKYSKSRHAKNIYKAVREISSEIYVKDMFQINEQSEHYIKDETRYIRYSKALYNMAFLATTSKKYSFILSGEDEKIMWEIYNQRVGTSRKYKLANICIPKMIGYNCKGTSVLDNQNNINQSDTLTKVKDKVKKNLECLDEKCNCFGFLYALKYIVFYYGNKIHLQASKNTTTTISTLDELLNHLLQIQNDSVCYEVVITQLSGIVYNLLHPKL